MSDPTSSPQEDTATTEWSYNPHAYHRNLPPHHFDQDGIPYITKFAQRKACQLLKLAHSIQLTENLFVKNSSGDDDDNYDETEETLAEDEDDEVDLFTSKEDTMASIIKKCSRLNSQLSSLASLKHSGVTEAELSNMVLHLFRLVTATVTIQSSPDDDDEMDLDKMSIDKENKVRPTRRATIHFDNVGYIFHGKEELYENAQHPDQLEKELSEEFALPPPARESLLSVLISLLSKKALLYSVSNSALYPENDNNSKDRWMLILHWKPLLRMLLRTAPYLDEHKVGNPPICSNSKQNAIVRRTVHLIRHARHFFDQGIRPPGSVASKVRPDAAARDIWEMVRSDLLYHTHTHSCYRAIILLYLFQPSRCTSAFYLEVMPQWMESWSSIDRCPEFDFLWLVVFCRARKHVSPEEYDWGPLRRRLLTQCQYWLQLPVGGSSGDKSFPRAASPRSRSCPTRLKAFVGIGSSYEEGIDFIAKVAKLLVTSIGTDDCKPNDDTTPESSTSSTVPTVSHGTEDILRFLSFVAPYFNPSNVGSWTFTMGAFLHYFCYELCHRIGAAAGYAALNSSNPSLAAEICAVEPSQAFAAVPPHEIVALVDALLPLCQQALYSKNGHVGRAGEAAMVYLTQIDPIHIAPPFLDFATRALDVSAVNLAHQAPAALSAMTRIVQPALRRDPSVLLGRLPEILRLSLAGIDSNDQNKTIRTLIFYRNLASWIPVGGCPESWASVTSSSVSRRDGDDGTIRMGHDIAAYLSAATQSASYKEALRRLPETSLLFQTDQQESDGLQELGWLVQEAASALSDWSLAFLDRIYALLRASGEREKTGKNASGVASRHSSADVQQTRNFSRVLKECLLQLFSAMDEDTHKSAVRSVAQFLVEESLPFASKDASALCQAVAGARVVEDSGKKSTASPGLDALVPILTENLELHSSKTVVYRLRCLAGAVRRAGRAVFKHRMDIRSAIDYSLSSEDKHVFKTGCKLLRHTLASQCEAYPLSSDYRQRSETTDDAGNTFGLGKSSHLRDDPVEWHVPDGEQVDFACELTAHAMRGIDEVITMGMSVNSDVDSSVEMVDEEDGQEQDEGKEIDSARSKKVNLHQLRRTLRIIRYVLRGSSGILLDGESDDGDAGMESTDPVPEMLDESPDNGPVPHERAVRKLLVAASSDTLMSLMQMKGRICAFAVCIASIIASEMAAADANAQQLLNGSSPGTTSAETSRHSGASSGDEQLVPGSKPTPSLGLGAPSLLSSDTKVCKEISDIALLLLTRRGASFRCQEAKAIWKAQKQLVTDYVLAAEADCMAAFLQRAALYEDCRFSLYKDGEDGGKTLPRRLILTRIQLFYESIQRSASFEIPRRLRRLARLKQTSGTRCFTSETSMAKAMTGLSEYPASGLLSSLDGYEGLVDGLFALACHSNTHVRASGFGVIDYAVTRFGWLVPSRVPQLLSALQLVDENGKYGIPSCAELRRQVDAQGKHKRLAEVVKGVCCLISMPRAVAVTLECESIRFNTVKTLCGTESLISLMPPEEMQKIVHYLHSIFTPVRSKFFSLRRATEKIQSVHKNCLAFLMDILSDENPNASSNVVHDSAAGTEETGDIDAGDGITTANSAHWKNRLLAGWFLTAAVDRDDLLSDDPKISARLWSTCFQLLQNEMGQPLQRVAVGLLGRLVSFALPVDARLNIATQNCGCQQKKVARNTSETKNANVSALCEKLQEETFCRMLGKAIVFDHKEDTSVGGGHQAQWSAGVEEILRDASSNVASRTLFPFQRTNRSSTIKVHHAQLIESLLLLLGREKAYATAEYLLAFAKDMACAPPSEDQRNEQSTSAELFAGVCRAMLLLAGGPDERSELWKSLLLPFLDDVIPKIPISLVGAFFDAFRYGIHFFNPSFFYELTAWVINKVESTLWQPLSGSESNEKPQVTEQGGETTDNTTNDLAAENVAGGGSVGTDGFTAQSKWLYLANSILVELDEEMDVGVLCRLPWYTDSLIDQDEGVGSTAVSKIPVDDLRQSWKLVSERLLPRLLEALGHPYESCREHIAGCLFRICYCHRKMASASMAPRRKQVLSEAGTHQSGEQEPGDIIVQKLASLETATGLSFRERYNALIAAQKFIAYCLHLGDFKHEYSNFIIPLLPLAFEALKATKEESTEQMEEGSKEDAAKRALEAEVVKSFRYSIAEVSSSAVIYYGKDEDIAKVLSVVGNASKHEYWQVRQAAAHFLRCFQGYHKFLFHREHAVTTITTTKNLLADERREVSSAAMAALTGILAATPLTTVTSLVNKYVALANRSKIKRTKKKGTGAVEPETAEEAKAKEEKEAKRARNQQTSVFFLCAAVLARPYDTPPYVPEALAALSKHSFERSAPLGVRDTVKKCCAEFKRTHMSDNWDVHRRQFTQEQLEALEDVVSSPHYYA